MATTDADMPTTDTDMPTTGDTHWTPERVRVLRARLGLSRRELGARLYAVGDGPGRMAADSAYQQVRRFETGEREPTAAVVASLERLAADAEM